MEELANTVLHNLSTNLTLSTALQNSMDESDNTWDYAIVGKTVVPTGRDCEGIAAALANCWEFLRKKPAIVAVTNELFIIGFKSPADLKIALERGPWRVYGQVFLFKKHNMAIAPQARYLNTFTVWFSFEDLPFSHWSVKGISKLLANVTPIDDIYPEYTFPKANVGYQVLTTINCQVPLPLGVPAKDEFGGTKFVLFVYKNLPAFFCTLCRRVGHKIFTCPQRFMGLEGSETSNGNSNSVSIDGNGDAGFGGNDNSVAREIGNSGSGGVGNAASAIDGVDEASTNPNPLIMTNQVFSPSSGLLKNPTIQVGLDSIGLVAGQIAGKSLPKSQSHVYKPMNPLVVTNMEQLIEPDLNLPTAASNDNQFSHQSIDSRQKGKRNSGDNFSIPSKELSKKSRLESICESALQINQQRQEEICDISSAPDKNSSSNLPDFLGYQLGNLPDMVNEIRNFVPNVKQNFLGEASTGLGINQRSLQASLASIAEFVPVSNATLAADLGDINGGETTRLMSFPLLFPGGKSGEDGGALAYSKDNDRVVGFPSLDAAAGSVRVEQVKIELQTQREENVLDSDMLPLGRTA